MHQNNILIEYWKTKILLKQPGVLKQAEGQIDAKIGNMYSMVYIYIPEIMNSTGTAPRHLM